jgi:hypothetical protein
MATGPLVGSTSTHVYYKMIDITNSQISTDRRTVLKMGAIYNELVRYIDL